MIAPLHPSSQRLSGQAKRAHMIPIEQQEEGVTDKINRMLTAKPVVSLVAAAGVGIAIGWFVKRKQW